MIWLIIIVAVAALLFYKPKVKEESVLGVDSPIVPASVEYEQKEYDVSPVAVTNGSVTSQVVQPGGEVGVLGFDSPIIAQYSGISEKDTTSLIL